jgi:signal transduction histidine kinase
MLESSGSLQLHSKPALSNVNLLIVSNQSAFQAIASCLDEADISFYADLINPDQLSDRPSSNIPNKYSAICYDYTATPKDNHIESLISKLQWWGHLYPDTPVILITDVLGDEAAAQLIQSGVNGYVLRHKLYQLPSTLKKSLFDFASNQAIVKQQQDLIKQQQFQLQQLQAEIKIRSDAEKTQAIRLAQQQKIIEQEEKKVQQLEAEIQSWIEGEETKQEHLSHLNHELRSPISSMLGFAGMLKEEYYGELNEKQMRYVKAMVSVGQYMLDLVNNYLDIAKIDANKQTLELERLAVAEVCQNALFCLEKKAEQKELKLNFDLGDEIDFCTADSRCLRQILINLLSNAVKFTKCGNITLQVQQDAEFLNFAVLDTGVGISAENIIKLFKPFPQISNHQESTGLGLALSRKLARLHGGDIVVSSELGKGSCFTLSIPRFSNY